MMSGITLDLVKKLREYAEKAREVREKEFELRRTVEKLLEDVGKLFDEVLYLPFSVIEDIVRDRGIVRP